MVAGNESTILVGGSPRGTEVRMGREGVMKNLDVILVRIERKEVNFFKQNLMYYVVSLERFSVWVGRVRR